MNDQHAITLAFGPGSIHAISAAVEQLLPWLVRSSYRLLPSGNLEFTNAEAAEAIRLLRAEVEAVLPDDVRTRIGTRSGLGWNIFFGHVVTWWLPQRRWVGFLRALVDRAALHGVQLQLHWNAGRTVPVERVALGREAFFWGGGFGVLAAIAAARLWPSQAMLPLLLVAAGVVAGRIWQRVSARRLCGDPLCRAPLGRAATCPSCGAHIEDAR